MKTKLFFLSLFLTTLFGFGQAPEKFSYQAVCRDGSGAIISNQKVNFRISIHDLTPSGNIVYQETHTATTNTMGLVYFEVGGGTVESGVFAAIPWNMGSKYLEISINFGNGYTTLGESQLLSVPYAIYANKCGNQGKVGGASWDITGNSGVVDSLNFIGTIDPNSLNFRVNNQKAGKIDHTGSTVLGYMAGKNNLNTNLTGFGYLALYYNTSGNNNTAFGYSSLYKNTMGNDNSAFGKYALTNNISGNANTAFGSNSLGLNSTGSNNSGFGGAALYSNTTGSGNTCNGNNALYLNTTGSYNSSLGNAALNQNTTGKGNSALGYKSLRTNSTGSYNTAIGDSALYFSTTGSNNIAIGKNAGSNHTSNSNRLYINSIKRSNIQSDSSNSIIYGVQSANTVDQRLYVNSNLIVSDTFKMKNYTFPVSHGLAGQTLVDIEGTGNLTWSSIVGQMGPTGPTGATGANGLDGINGATGPTGAVGANGINGATGPTGATGATGAAGVDGWLLSGNAGTSTLTNFIGTSDAVDLVFKSNNVERVRILSNGNTGFGTPTPNVQVDIAGGVAMRPTAVSATTDNQIVLVSNVSFLQVTSNSGTASLRTLSIGPGSQAGQILYIENMSNQRFELRQGTGSVQITPYSPVTFNKRYDNCKLLWDGSAWIIMSVAKAY